MNAPTLPAVFEHPQAHSQVVLGTTRVSYHLRRSQRQSIGLLITDQGLTVSAPNHARQSDIEQALQAKASWILRKLVQQREKLRQRAAGSVQWGDGARIPCMGGWLHVHLQPGLAGAQGSSLVALAQQATASGMAGELLQAQLYLGLALDSAPAHIRDATAAWLQTQALALFQQRCALYAPRLGVRPSRLGLSAARTRWGSATAGGTIRLNWHLIHFGLPVVDYVVAHELAHLRQMNHSPAFWALVQTVIPDVAACKAALRQLPPHWD
jgi:predicted metal-dependent hydrolase